MTTATGGRHRSAPRQALRGVGFFVGLVVALFAMVLLWGVAEWLLGDGTGWDIPGWRRASALVIGLVVVGGSVVTWRRLRAWVDRPRWLVPAAAAVLVVGLLPALILPAPADDFTGSPCVPIADAWRPAVTASASDLAFFQAGMHNGLPSSVHDRASLAAYTASQRARQQAPAYQRASRYELWAAGGGSCAPRSRVALGWSAVGLGLGAAALSLGVRRRRR